MSDKIRKSEILQTAENQMEPNDDAASEVAESSVEELLDQIAYITDSFPKEALEAIISKREQAIPFLLDILRNTRDNPVKYRDEESYFAHIYAAYLLAQFRVKEAYAILIDILSFPDDLPDELFGDALLDDGSRMLASVCGSDTILIKTLAENEKADEYMRSRAIDALVILALHNVLERDEVIAYYKKLIKEPGIVNNSQLLSFLVCACIDLYPEELYEDIKKCYEEDLVDESIVGMESVDDAMRQEKDHVLEEYRNNKHLQFIDDTVAELERWGCFEETYRKRMDSKQNYSRIQPVRIQPVRNQPKIGRNDPCPCGSGKKYKKCCGR